MKIMNWLRASLIQRSVQKELVLHEKRLAQKPKTIKKIAVLVNSRSSVSADVIEQNLKQNGFEMASIAVFEFDPKATKPSEESTLSFGSGDFSLLGTPFSKVESFSNTSYDLLVNYFKEDNPYLQFVSLKTSAKFRVGFSGVDNRLNDLMFSLSETDSTLFCKQMNTYLNNINAG